MSVNEVFRQSLLAAMREKQMSAAELSRKAGLNKRAVKDIEEERAMSPKLSTVFALANALNCDPGELIGLGPRPQVIPDLLRYLSEYAPDDQERILAALRALPIAPHEER